MQQDKEQRDASADLARLEAEQMASTAAAEVDSVRQELQAQCKEIAAARAAAAAAAEAHAAELQRLESKLSQFRQVYASQVTIQATIIAMLT